MSELTWIVGRGGLLGSAMSRALVGPEFRPSQSLSWGSPELAARFAAGAQELGARVARDGVGWRVCWCAGAGVVGSTAESLAGETQSLRQLLSALASEPALVQMPGTFVLSSSAGGVHGGGGAGRISEASEPRPISAYGRAKLEQEGLLKNTCTRFAGLSTLTARLSNLYGPGQRMDKPQGLISQIAHSVVRYQPVRIYVPLDTTRDYLFVDDAARALVAGAARLAAAPAGTQITKLYAAERDTSIANLLAIFRSIAKRRLKVISGLHAASREQPRHISFRSAIWAADRDWLRTDLVSGVALTYRDQLLVFQRGVSNRP